MTPMPFKVNFRDTPHSEEAQGECESLAQGLRAEFPETSRVEVTLGHDREEFEAHVHVTGKDIDLAARAKTRESLVIAAREAFHRAHAQLRKHHDKLIFKSRRDGHKPR
jgi:ribosome-associated translation inhibitor RaiA